MEDSKGDMRGFQIRKYRLGPSEHCTVYSVQYTLNIIHCTMYTVQCTMYSVQCTVYDVQCTV